MLYLLDIVNNFPPWLMTVHHSLSSIVILTLDHAVRPAGVLQQWVREPVTHCVITRRARRSYQCGCGFAFYPRHLESLCAHNGATGHATRHRLDAGCYDTLEMPPRDVRIFGRPRPPRERGRGKPVCGVRRGAARRHSSVPDRLRWWPRGGVGIAEVRGTRGREGGRTADWRSCEEIESSKSQAVFLFGHLLNIYNLFWKSIKVRSLKFHTSTKTRLFESQANCW